MSVVGSGISATDLELFKNLANPAKIDTKKPMRVNQSSRMNIPPTTINGEDQKSDISMSSDPVSPPPDEIHNHGLDRVFRPKSAEWEKKNIQDNNEKPIVSFSRRHEHDDSSSRRNEHGGSSSRRHEHDDSSSRRNEHGGSSSRRNERGGSSSRRHEHDDSSSRRNERGGSSSRRNDHDDSSSRRNERGDSSSRRNERGDSSSRRQQHDDSSSRRNERGDSSSRRNERGDSSERRQQRDDSYSRRQKRGDSSERRLDRGASEPPIIRDEILNQNPFRQLSSSFKKESVIPPFYNHQKKEKISIFDKETDKYLQKRNSPEREKVFLKEEYIPSLKLPSYANSRLFSPNSKDGLLDDISPLDAVNSPLRHDVSRSRSYSRRQDKNKYDPYTEREHHRHSHRHHRHHREKRSSKSSAVRDQSADNLGKEIEQQEKRKYLLEFEKLKLKGISLTRPYTMSDSLADIKFEYDSHRSNFDVVDTVNFMKDILGAAFTFIEAANQRLGPLLQLKGWSTYMKQNIDRFDRLLERVYHRYWRHGQPSPGWEFGWLVFGSMLIWHVQTAYLGGLPVGEMLGLMGSGTAAPNRTSQQQQQPNNEGIAQNTGGSSSGGNNGGIGSTLGNILRMFTGGGNANRPAAAQATQPQFGQRPPIIIPPVPGSAQPQQQQESNSRSQSSRPVASGMKTSTSSMTDNQLNSDKTSETKKSESVSNSAPTSNALPPSNTIPPSQTMLQGRSLPATSTVATLPIAKIQNISQNQENRNESAQRRMLRRPSTYLSAANTSPLFPISESSNENSIPSPP
jgi:hypothetical protein